MFSNDAMKDFQKDLKDAGSNGVFAFKKELKNDGNFLSFRVLPALPHMSKFCQEVKKYWINKQPYVSPTSFQKDAFCPIQDALDKAAASGDLGVKEIASGINYSTSYYAPCLIIDCNWVAGQPQNVTIRDQKIKICELNKTQVDGIVAIYFNPMKQNGTRDGCFDQHQGFNFMTNKTGEGKKTRYKVECWASPMPMHDFYYTNVPDVVEFTKKGLKSNEELTTIINTALYGSNPIQYQAIPSTPAAYNPALVPAPVAPVYAAPVAAVPAVGIPAAPVAPPAPVMAAPPAPPAPVIAPPVAPPMVQPTAPAATVATNPLLQ